MLPDQAQKTDIFSGRNLFFMAAGLVMVCQLAAMGLVAGDQVKKAELRNSRLSLQRVAIARCFEFNSRAERQDCMLQARDDTFNGTQFADNAKALNARESASYTDFNRGFAPADMRMGVMAVSFAAN